jgi:hypothetical protein
MEDQTKKKKLEEIPTNDYKENNITELFPREDWISLVDELEGSLNFRCKVKSHPEDAFRRVYALTSGEKHPSSPYCWEDKIVISITESNIHVEVMSYNNQFIKDFLQVLFKEPLRNMPLYINSKKEIIKKVSNWRLRRGK